MSDKPPNHLMVALAHSLDRYRSFVVGNPQLISEIESGFRWISYFSTMGKWQNAEIISELLYSTTNLVQLLNDGILRKAAQIHLDSSPVVEYLRIFLSILEYTEVFSEFTARRFYGDVARWTVVAVIQITKAIIKLVLLFKFRQGLQRNQSIAPLDRVKELRDPRGQHLGPPLVDPCATSTVPPGTAQDQPLKDDQECEIGKDKNENSTFVLKRSGRVIRTIDKAPNRKMRLWNPPSKDGKEGPQIETISMQQFLDKHKRNAPSSPLNNDQIIGEAVHILRPVAHLALMGGLGTASWIPYMVSLGMDMTSLKLLCTPSNKLWNVNERIELGQRSFALMLYLLRSPFYDRFTKERVLRILRFLADHVPLFGRFIRPMVNYLPEWQKTYFYVWGV